MMKIYDRENKEWLERETVDGNEMLVRGPQRYSLEGPAEAPVLTQIDASARAVAHENKAAAAAKRAEAHAAAPSHVMGHPGKKAGE